MFRKFLSAIVASVVALALMKPVHAGGIPVIDVAAIAQLIQQLNYWQQQIIAMNNQLNQLRASYDAITGNRGMEGLLPYSYQQRNYLPEDYAQLIGVLNNAGTGYGGLASLVQSVMNANAVLSQAQMSAMSPESRRIIENSRRATAMLQSMSQQALSNTSQRFAALQQLITIIGAAGDDKAIQDLQGRVSAEQTMLQNEQTKLQTLYQIAQSERWANEQRVREEVIAGQGEFATRFQPTP